MAVRIQLPKLRRKPGPPTGIEERETLGEVFFILGTKTLRFVQELDFYPDARPIAVRFDEVVSIP